jgi:hypothetical protein
MESQRQIFINSDLIFYLLAIDANGWLHWKVNGSKELPNSLRQLSKGIKLRGVIKIVAWYSRLVTTKIINFSDYNMQKT